MEFRLISSYTKEQVLRALSDWGCTNEELPKKGRCLYIAFPNRSAIRVTKSAFKSSYGKTLYDIEHAVS